LTALPLPVNDCPANISDDKKTRSHLSQNADDKYCQNLFHPFLLSLQSDNIAVEKPV
jgi:hypothetical protein